MRTDANGLSLRLDGGSTGTSSFVSPRATAPISPFAGPLSRPAAMRNVIDDPLALSGSSHSWITSSSRLRPAREAPNPRTALVTIGLSYAKKHPSHRYFGRAAVSYHPH